MLRVGALLFTTLLLHAAPHTLINALQYPALKDSLISGDAAFAFAIRDPDGPPQQEGGMRVFKTVWNEAKFQKALDALNAIHDPRVQKQVIFSSIEDLKRNIERLPKDVHWIGYNMEPSMTPREELMGVDKAVVAFGSYCHEHGLKLNWVPGGFRAFDDDTRLGPILQAVDEVVLQLQHELQNQGVETFVKLARERVARIRKLNPKVEVNVQVVIGRGSREDLVKALKTIAPDVDGETLWTMNDTDSVKEILSVVR